MDTAGVRAWLVGGALRDLLSGLKPADLDLVTEADPVAAARGFADSTGGSFVLLSEEFRTCRVVAADRRCTYDFTAMRGGSITADLAYRDFTVNAMARGLPPDAELIDPFGGRDDLRAHRLAAVSPSIFRDDPLRLLRAARLEFAAGLVMGRDLEDMVRGQAALAGRPAAERTFGELVLLLQLPHTAAAVRRLDDLGLLKVLLPELCSLQGVKQNRYHHLDVYEHTLAHAETLARIVVEPASFFPEAEEQIVRRRRRPGAGAAGWDFIMGFASLMHDIAKPCCAFTDSDGQTRFFEHDRRGSETARRILARFKAGARVSGAVSFLVAGHMRFESLIQAGTPGRRARLRYLRATHPFSPELIMMSVADRLSVRGPLVSGDDIRKHLRLAREMMVLSFAEEEVEPPPRIINGDELMQDLGLGPGPVVGRILGRIEEEQRLGNITTREQAVAAARRFREELT